ncbi:microtubule-associated tumor suppressor 1 homolog A isoform X1 [Etheostoma cragini]|uniref:microtubule-associated tumor suppressor 1 homolog A isoform X1 n=1 Tax=Etheostoma cragini TaxID=417921 RepID=UPI00155E265E|nr:microtubule-associated tumor suppressor 1 homolog A isoform X1 [Etheostoma cragini]XP_034739429.1 microtubule-associated tumor suppressor 1 homolog A isoform X1 [Etheostoma cragini]XP_034739430.1 microtubule-associated tumor suppressor 1 homolog A isoform X1 [Etheostoma cragini]
MFGHLELQNRQQSFCLNSKMSNRTFSMDQVESTVPLPSREALALENHDSNSPLSPSPDSNSSISNLSDREANSSPDINMLEGCLSDSSSVDNSYNITLSRDNVFSGTSMNLNQSLFATPDNGSGNFCNRNLSLTSNHETGSNNYQTFYKNTDDRSNRAATSPDSAGRSLGETSRRGSTENDCCSLSSGEMVIRSNSFCLEDQSPLLVSSLEESFISLAAGNPALPVDSNQLSTTLSHLHEKSTERVIEENAVPPCLGMTFTHTELPTEENDEATSNSLLALPSENEIGHMMTFVCETSPADCGKEAQFVEAELLPHFPVAFTPEQGKNLVATMSAAQATEMEIHTSTPVQNIGNMLPSLPSFSESPCTENPGSPGFHPVKLQQISMTHNHLVAGLVPSDSKVKKTAIKKFPKSDFSSVKSKVLTRSMHQIVPGPASQLKPSHVNVNNKQIEAHRVATTRFTPAKLRSSTAVVSTTTKMVNDAQRRVNTGSANLGTTIIQSSGHTTEDGQEKGGASTPYHHPAANNHASAFQCSKASSVTEQAASSQVADTAAQHSGNQTFCWSALEKSPDKSKNGQTAHKPAPINGVLNIIDVEAGSALGQDKTPVLNMRPRCSSESSAVSSRPPREKRTTLKYSNSFTIVKAKTKPGHLDCSSRNKPTIPTDTTNGPAENSTREVRRISLVAESSKSTTSGASWDERKSKYRAQTVSRQARGAPPSVPPAASPRPVTLSTRQRQGPFGRDEYRTSKAAGTPQSKQKSSTCSQRVQAKGESSLGTASTASNKPQLGGSQPPHTSTQPIVMGPPPTPTSRLPVPHKTPGPSRSVTHARVNSELSGGAGRTQVFGGAAHKPSPLKTVVLKARLITTPGKATGPSLAIACRPATSSSKGASNSTVSPLKRTASARLVGLTSSGTVDKNKPKASSRHQHPQQPASQLNQRSGAVDVVPASAAEGGRKDQSIQQLKGLLAASNCRFEAVAIVLQEALAERDEARRQCRDLSQELGNLRGELVCSVHSSECLEKEKEELRVALEDALHKLQEQHQKDLAELEQRLQAFYQAEWDKVHLSYQQETDKGRTLLQQQMGELKDNHEVMRLELENSHAEQLQSVKQQYEMSLEELRKVHSQELQSLERTLKETGDALSGQIEKLTMENNALIEKLAEEENRRKQLADKSQKDSHTLYLEQELESLKVVLDIKNKQLHQQEKKMMEIDKLMEKNVKLDESLIKVQQENEDLKARMERHAALSRQLSTEQTALQETLQKESKVNKRLSMENEELMWKLHNGDLSSPRKVSPTSASSPSPHSFSFQSPRSSGLLSSPPVSPR